MFALLEAYHADLLKPKNWLSNFMAGIIVGTVALPLAMAFAIASGAKPEQGLYTAIIAALIVGIFGGSRVQIAGPTGAFVAILATITAQHGIVGLEIASLLAGFILVFMGLMKLGNVIKYIPRPVIIGFTAGIGFIIFVGEWKDFFGLSINLPLDAPFHQKIVALLHALIYFDFTTTSLAILSLFIILITPKIFRRIPGPLVAMVSITLLQAIFHFKGVATLGSAFNGISQHLPHFQVPNITFNTLLNLIVPAFSIALLGAIESLLSATAADNMTGTRHNSNQELIGQGLANIIVPLFGGFAATGAIARTATNIRNGGNSPISAVVHSIVLFLVILILAPLAVNVPLCSLAAILFVVAYNMSDIPHFSHIIRTAPRYDVFILLATFLLTVFTNLVIAVNAGVILAMLFFIARMKESTTIVEQHTGQNGAPLPKEILVYSIHGPLFFGVAEKLSMTFSASQVEHKTIIFRLKDVPFMDTTGLESLTKLIEQFTKRKIKVYLCEANALVLRKLNKVGILKHENENIIFNTFPEILAKF